jgi:predicted RNase H-like HicB family nuclease
MTTYDLYLESGAQYKKTLVHILDLLGCVVTGPTTEDALEATPDAIRAYLRLLKRTGENVDPKAPMKTRVAQHIIGAAQVIGMDSSYITFDPDLKPVTPRDIETYAARFHALREELATWVESQSDKQLDAKPKAGGRPARKVILHLMNATGYLSPLVGTIRGMSALTTAAERGAIPLPAALRQVDAVIAESLRAATPAQRRAIGHLSPERTRTVRKAIRRTLEHDWEHLAELSRRPGGPTL